MKRIGGLKQQIAAGVHTPSVDGRTPAEQIRDCLAVIREIQADQKRIFDDLMVLLEAKGIRLVKVKDLAAEARQLACATPSRPTSFP